MDWHLLQQLTSFCSGSPVNSNEAEIRKTARSTIVKLELNWVHPKCTQFNVRSDINSL
jgi:hypothetical protein